MRKWQGIRRDTDSTLDDGPLLLINTSLYTDGEMMRRPGMSAFAMQSGVAITNFWTPLSGFRAIYATSAGTVISLAAS